jgi:hypothetical protein
MKYGSPTAQNASLSPHERAELEIDQVPGVAHLLPFWAG